MEIADKLRTLLTAAWLAESYVRYLYNYVVNSKNSPVDKDIYNYSNNSALVPNSNFEKEQLVSLALVSRLVNTF